MAERGAAARSQAPAGDEHAAPGRIPDFFIVGHEKCGTTALDAMLKRHPQIFMPEVKEQRYFAPELRSRFIKPGEPGGVHRPTTLEGYRAVFAQARADQLVGEASPMYLRSREAAQRIAQVQPHARIIALLREPVSYLRSLHLQNLANNIENQRDLRRAIALEPARAQGRRIPRRSSSPAALMYSQHVRYTEQLGRYYDAFGSEQVLVLIFEEFQRDNAATLRRVLRFLGVDEDVELEPVRTPSVRDVRSPLLKALSDSARAARTGAPQAGTLGRALDALVPRALRTGPPLELWRRLMYPQAPPPDERLSAELRSRFKPEVVAVSKYLGRDLVALWGYEGID